LNDKERPARALSINTSPSEQRALFTFPTPSDGAHDHMQQMQFTPEQRDLIHAGRKTVHRIPAAGECRYQEGRAYRTPIIGEDKPLVITVVAPVTRQRISDMKARDAAREHAKDLPAWREAFEEEHGSCADDRELFVIELAPGDRRDVPRFLASGGPAPICKAPRRDADGNVTHRPGSPIIREGKVISERLVLCNRAFAVGQHVCACGARRPPESADDYGYTTSHARAIDDGEALSDADLEQYAWAASNDRGVMRDLPAREAIAGMLDGIATLREALAKMKERQGPFVSERRRLRLMEQKVASVQREGETLLRELPSEAGV
jgi:hypothetical protein